MLPIAQDQETCDSRDEQDVNFIHGDTMIAFIVLLENGHDVDFKKYNKGCYPGNAMQWWTLFFILICEVM